MRWVRPIVCLAAWVIPSLLPALEPVRDGSEFKVHTYTTSQQRRPRAAAGPDGQFVVVWQSYEQDGSHYGVFGRVRDSAGAPIGGEFQVPQFTTGSQNFPSVAMGPSGDFVVVWESYGQDGAGDGIFGRLFDLDGLPAGDSFPINLTTSSDQRWPMPAFSADGTFVVVWHSNLQDGSSYGVFGQRFDGDGLPLGGEFQVNTFTPNEQWLPAVGIDGAGNFVVVWESQGQDSLGGIFGRRFDAWGAPLGGEFQVTGAGQPDEIQPRVAMNEAGDFVVAWTAAGLDGESGAILARQFNPAGVARGGAVQVNTFWTGFQGFPDVGIDASGSFVVTWQSYYQDGDSYGIFGQRFVPQGAAPLAGEVPVAAGGGIARSSPSMTRVGDQQFLVVWQDGSQDGDGSGIFAGRFDDGGHPLGPASRINTYTASFQTSPDVGGVSGGPRVVVWQSDGQDGSSSGVFGQRFASSGAPIGGEFQVNTSSAGSQSSPRVSTNMAGRTVIVWNSDGQDGSGRAILGRLYTDSGVPVTAELQINTFTPLNQGIPDAAIDAAGAFVVVWQSYGQDGSGNGVFAQRYDPQGNRVGPEFQVNQSIPLNQDAAAIGMDGSGGFVVVWQSQEGDGSGRGIVGRVFHASGLPAGGEFLINTFTTGAQTLPEISMEPTGEFIVTWVSRNQDGSGDGIVGRRFDASGTAMGDEFLINTTTSGNQTLPAVGMSAGGRFLVVWENGAAAQKEITGRAFDLKPSPDGAEFRLNTYTLSSQNASSAAMAPSGSFVVAWESYFQDDSYDGVFAQRYADCPLEPVTDLVIAPVSGGSELLFKWSDWPEAADYMLHEDVSADGSFAALTATGASGVTGLTIPAPAGSVYYLVAARNTACGPGPKR